jgi:hypothetical protein
MGTTILKGKRVKASKKALRALSKLPGASSNCAIDQKTNCSDGLPLAMGDDRDSPTGFRRFHDEQLAIEFLSGQFISEPNGWYARRYLAPDSDRERMAKAGFVRLLRSDVPLDDEIRGRLADLFDPGDCPSHDRELVFKDRAPGKCAEWQRDIQIAGHVFFKVARGIKVEAAIQEAMARFSVKRPTAYRAWKAWREFVSKIEITTRP